ncbi:MAG TPA: Ig-like domain-containing protein [Bacteroidia bacterium]|nr:Ig-like domain-containing protein [Bacteroidia bacterium]
MILKRFFSFSFLIFVIVLFNNCAQIGPLTGGSKDVTPPKLLSAFPKDTSTNVPIKNATFIFQFDEMVDVKSVSSAMIINPITDNKPEVRASGKKMIVSFDDDLQPNTTYQIQFGKSIGDIHENNKYKNLTYIFSTGSTIDTNTISGNANWALTSAPMKDVSVMLFTNLTDTAATRTKPSYVVKTDSAGTYSLSAIKPGTYQIVAVIDKNNNNAYDNGEVLGFMNSPLTISGNDTVNFIMSTPKNNRTFIKKKIQAFWGYNKFILSDTLPGAYILYINKNQDADKITYETKNDTLEVYYKDIFDTELKLLVKNDQSVLDTITINIPSAQKVDSTISKNLKKVNVNPNKKIFGIANDDVFLNFSFPIKSIDIDKCSLLHDSTSEKLLITNENKNENNNLVTTYLPLYKKGLLNKLIENKTYTLMFLPNSLTTYWGKMNADTIKTTFKTYATEDIGTLKIKLTLPDSIHNYILQLLGTSGNVVTEYISGAKKENIVTFYNLTGADYSLRLINDVDANKKFTPANFNKHIQPETVYIYSKSIKVPAGWDVETDWNFISSEKK